MYDIIVIGAGFSGAYACLELAKDKYKILVIEKNSQVVGLDSTSYNQCYKLHSGVHYFGDAITARKCLIDSVVCARQWSDFLLGGPRSLPRRNRHYIMSNSFFDTEEAKKVALMLKQTYARLTQEDFRNQVFGDPKDFIQEVGPEQYNYAANEITYLNQDGSIEKTGIVLALDVGEPQINIQKAQKYLQHKITHTENIETMFNCDVISVERCANGVSYKVKALQQDKTGKTKTIEFTTKGIVNCAWQNIENLNETAGIYEKDNQDKLLIRMKISLLIKLPQKLENMDTCIFSLGPYCSVTNQYDGTAILTYEPATNVGHYFCGEATPESIKNIQLHKNNLSETHLGQKIAKDIVDGCAIYIPELKYSQILEVRIGYVKMHVNQHDGCSIYNKNSSIHRRREDGIVLHDENIYPCYISVSGIKMTYAQSNAEKIRFLMKKEMERKVCNKREITDKIKTDELVLQGEKKFVFEAVNDYKLANEKKSLLRSSLLKDVVTSKYFTPKDKDK